MFGYFTRSYQRKKRIQRIIALKEGHEGGGFLFPRYTWLRFFLTVAAMIVMSGTVSYVLNALFGSVMGVRLRSIVITPMAMVFGFLAVEIVDSFFLQWEKAYDEFRRSVAPLLALLVLVFGYILFKNPEAFVASIKDWRTRMSQDIQILSLPIIVLPSQGLNWRLQYASSNHLNMATYSEASGFCKSLGVDWQVYDGDKMFYAHPNPKFDRVFLVWTKILAGQLGPAGIQRPRALRSTTLSDRLAVLCINKRIHP